MWPLAKVLLVDDNANIRQLMEIYLKRQGFDVYHAEHGSAALDLLSRQHIDLIVADILMPEMDGYELTCALRGAGFTLPILIVTAKHAWPDKKQGFQSGADDYMVKPIDMDELVLRVVALLRRARISVEQQVRVGDIVLDAAKFELRQNGQEHALPRKEFQVLFKLLSSPGKIFTRQELLDEFWGLDSEVDERTVDVHIKRLRDKFAHQSEFEIVTVRGLGYKAVRRI
ncbi:MAG: Heme response regulator HssR [Firmicutes bacterium]|nr:Heme response regulator HssR [candidate division NPL-UPA2 bacterium]